MALSNPMSAMLPAYRDVMLQRRDILVQQEVSSYLLRHAEFDIAEGDYMRNTMLARLKAHVYGMPKEYEKVIVERFRYPTWKDHLMAELPEGSFRRRFLERFWFKPSASQLTHEIHLKAEAMFPECEMEFPDQLGRVVFGVYDATDTILS